jgi:predicted DNA-binding transcriptional regulator AlpA
LPTNTISDEEPLLTKREMAAYLRLQPRQFDRWREKYNLPCLQIGGYSLRFMKSEVMAALRKTNVEEGS